MLCKLNLDNQISTLPMQSVEAGAVFASIKLLFERERSSPKKMADEFLFTDAWYGCVINRWDCVINRRGCVNNQMRLWIWFACYYNTYKVIFHYADTGSIGFALRDVALAFFRHFWFLTSWWSLHVAESCLGLFQAFSSLTKLWSAFSGTTSFRIFDDLSGISRKWLH